LDRARGPRAGGGRRSAARDERRRRPGRGRPAAGPRRLRGAARLPGDRGVSPAAADSLLITAGLTAFYGDFQALFGIGFAVGRGEVVAIVGANGAGKSTFLGAIAGLLAVPARQVLLDGEPIGGLPAHRIAARGLALVPEGRRLFPSLTVEE